MDFEYVLKRMLGMVTPEEEQAHRARQAAQPRQLRQAPVQPAPAAAPAHVMPGNALRERQLLLEEAYKELNRQNGLRRAPPIIGTRG